MGQAAVGDVNQKKSALAGERGPMAGLGSGAKKPHGAALGSGQQGRDAASPANIGFGLRYPPGLEPRPRYGFGVLSR